MSKSKPEPKPKHRVMANLHTIAVHLAEELGTTKHDVWFALFAISKNPVFNLEMKDYLKDPNTLEPMAKAKQEEK